MFSTERNARSAWRSARGPAGSATHALYAAGRRKGAARGVASVLACCVLTLTSGAVWGPQALADGRQGRASASDTGGPGHRSWPVDGDAGATRPRVVRGWHPPPQPWAAGHRGVDLAAPRGSPVRAAAGGRVVFVGKVAGRGVVSIAVSGTGRPPLRTTYEPVRATVRKGQRVRAGQRVGTVAAGPFHCPRGCLHWGARRGERYVDPLSLLPDRLLRAGPSRLLPVFGVPVPRSGGDASGTEARVPKVSSVAAVSSVEGNAGTAPGIGASGTSLLLAAGLGLGAWCAHRQLARKRGRAVGCSRGA
ncbi:M23 family metallopeptidase [Streptomyces nanshensis]|uniref:murein hydrolase activator EnvC family protein n=1 Tax=Streptomyces nanshensis TaxID=518642 RepID=UPI00099FF6F6